MGRTEVILSNVTPLSSKTKRRPGCLFGVYWHWSLARIGPMSNAADIHHRRIASGEWTSGAFVAESLSMKLSVLILAFALSVPAAAADLPRSTPEAEGVSSTAVLDYVTAASKSIDSLHSFMLLRHGHVVAEGWWAPYSADSPHALYSLSKSFTSTAVGLAIAEGKLSLDDPILKFFPDEAPAKPTANLRAMRIRDLLRMSTGQQTEPARTIDRGVGQDVSRPSGPVQTGHTLPLQHVRPRTCSRPPFKRRRGKPFSTT